MASGSETAGQTEPVTRLHDLGVNLVDHPAAWLTETAEELSVAFKTFLPNLIGAVALLLLGWLTAFIVRWLIHRFGKGLDAILAAINRWSGQKISRPHWSISKLVGDVSFWLIVAYALSAAAEQVGLKTFSEWVLGLLGYFPRVLIGAFILFVGYLISSGVRNLIVTFSVSTDFRHGQPLGQLASGLILAFSLLLALDELGLDVTIFSTMIVLAAGALFVGVAVAFGVGASDAIRNVMASHYVRSAYQEGQRVRINDVEGVILEMTQVAVIISTETGEAWIPARQFLETASVAVDMEPHENA